jgi:hypothetical protein
MRRLRRDRSRNNWHAAKRPSRSEQLEVKKPPQNKGIPKWN